LSVGVVNARFAKPLDTELLFKHSRQAALLVTMEDHCLMGGFGSAALEALQEAGISMPMVRLGWPDKFVDHGSSIDVLRAANDFSHDDCRRKILERFKQVHRDSVDALL
jgi:1-deoxy-D-xylulose-5-phosphate synthase